MKFIFIAIFAIFVVLVSVNAQSTNNSLTQQIAAESTLTNLNSRLTANTNLFNILNTSSLISYFAPVDSAFSNLNTLNNTGLYPDANTTLYYHATTQSISFPLPISSTLQALTGQNIFLNNYTTAGSGLSPVSTVNGAIINAVRSVTNGNLFLISGVIYPPVGNTVTTLTKLGSYSEAINFFSRASSDVQTQINNARQTILVPNNTAFNSFYQGLPLFGLSESTLSTSYIDAICRGLIVGFNFPLFSAAIPSSGLKNIPSAYQSNAFNVSNSNGISFSNQQSTITANVQLADVVTAGGGDLFIVDAVPYPASLFQSASSTGNGNGNNQGTTQGSSGGTTATTTVSSASSVHATFFILFISFIVFALIF